MIYNLVLSRLDLDGYNCHHSQWLCRIEKTSGNTVYPDAILCRPYSIHAPFRLQILLGSRKVRCNLKSHTVRYSPPGNSLLHTKEDFDNFDKTRTPPPPPKKKKKKKTEKKYILRTWIIQGTWCQKELGPEQVVFNHRDHACSDNKCVRY